MESHDKSGVTDHLQHRLEVLERREDELLERLEYKHDLVVKSEQRVQDLKERKSAKSTALAAFLATVLGVSGSAVYIAAESMADNQTQLIESGCKNSLEWLMDDKSDNGLTEEQIALLNSLAVESAAELCGIEALK